MKLKSLLFALCFCLIGQVFAANAHLHPKATEADKNHKSAGKSTMYPGYCEIEIINNSIDNVRVYGSFDDGAPLDPFTIFYYDAPHYISLYYYGYCHSGMNLLIQGPYGTIYSGWTNVNSTVRIVNYLNKGVKGDKVEITAKK
ncbi:hypothetical protein LEAN103870_13520 [Legionella anisa]|uniref:Uncharacterized protein n=2 Tax=Legionella TaxID=445 RepID=A0A1E5JPS9_9GAMM|nr:MULTISPECIES: hypothetical protein [Legionella]AWN73692.1 hypothetical protein DLD14_07480 [Legionella anisa]KTC70300.1 hypothetical protein Lani_1847 [Legionella anisa]KTD42090.1 hypothetical protein Lpar_3407 [Legionella parisiensis]MBN5936342.1 hypothetical protein [Legionella anisa]MCW8426585.1 hypothetical protein [Legionella anisa]